MTGVLPELQRLRAGVVGTGFIGLVHVEALRRLGIQVCGVVGSTLERAAAKAAAEGLPEPYRSYEAMLDDDRVDVVHITSPNQLHFEQAMAALDAGKHVVCEKPLALGSRQTGQLLAAAERSGLVHAVNFNVRFYPQLAVARERIGSDVRLVSGHYLQDWLLWDTDWNWRLDPEIGGSLRAVGDIGSHWLDAVGYVTGRRVVAAMADLTTMIPVRREPAGPVETFSASDGGASIERQVRTEDAAGILLRYEDGARGVLTVSQVSPGRKNACSFEVDGSAASVAWDSERPDELWIGHRDRPNEVLLRERGDYPPGHAQGFADTFKALYRAVYGAVAAGGPPARPDYPTFADGHEAALVGEAIARSAEEGRWASVERERERSRRMNVGIVGCGVIAHHYVEHASAFASFRVTACADMVADAARAFAATHGLAALDVDALLADPGIDVVLNLTPPAVHASVVTAALDAGKHVYTEKPLAIDPDDAARLLEHAEACGRRIGCAPDIFLGSAYQAARNLLDEGAIGTPLSVSASMLTGAIASWHPNPDIFYGAGAGPLLDMGPYYFTAIAALLGPVRRVVGFATTRVTEREIEIGPRRGERFPVTVPSHTAATLELSDGVLGSLIMSFETEDALVTDFFIHGTDGVLGLPDPNTFAGPVRLRQGRGGWRDVPIAPDVARDARGIGLDDFAEAIAQGRPHRASGALGSHVVETACAVLEAAASGAPVTLRTDVVRPAPMP